MAVVLFDTVMSPPPVGVKLLEPKKSSLVNKPSLS